MIFLFCSQMGSQEQPWALEQIGAQSAVQSKSFLSVTVYNIFYNSHNRSLLEKSVCL